MKSEKTFKAIIIVSLFVIESFVWTLSGSNDSWSMGIIGGTDGPGSTIISDDNNKNTETGEKTDSPKRSLIRQITKDRRIRSSPKKRCSLIQKKRDF